eukprot:6208367-Pleurochrysis_carterae.AAC.1
MLSPHRLLACARTKGGKVSDEMIDKFQRAPARHLTCKSNLQSALDVGPLLPQGSKALAEDHQIVKQPAWTKAQTVSYLQLLAYKMHAGKDSDPGTHIINARMHVDVQSGEDFVGDQRACGRRCSRGCSTRRRARHLHAALLRDEEHAASGVAIRRASLRS